MQYRGELWYGLVCDICLAGVDGLDPARYLAASGGCGATGRGRGLDPQLLVLAQAAALVLELASAVAGLVPPKVRGQAGLRAHEPV